MKMLRRLLSDEHGPTTVEYALLLSAIAAAILMSTNAIGLNTSRSFNSSREALEVILIDSDREQDESNEPRAPTHNSSDDDTATRG